MIRQPASSFYRACQAGHCVLSCLVDAHVGSLVGFQPGAPVLPTRASRVAVRLAYTLHEQVIMSAVSLLEERQVM